MKSWRIATLTFLLITALVYGGNFLLADIKDQPPAGGSGISVDIFGSASGLPMVRKDPVAVPLFKNTGEGADRMGLSRKFADLSSEDMRMTGRFDVIDRSMYVENPYTAGVMPGQFDFADWSVINAEYLIKGNFEVTESRLMVQFRLYHVPTKRLLVGKEYTGRPDDWALMTHRFSNDVVYELTREKGIFGTKIAFVSASGRTQELYVVDVDGNNLRRLTYLNGLAKNPTWSPDGKQIVFAWASADDHIMLNQLYAINANGGEPQKLLEIKGLIITPRFSPSGSRIAVAMSFEGNMEIYTVSAHGGKPQRLTNSNAIELFPSWSPQGDRLLFVSDRSGGPQIWMMRADGTEPHRVSYFGAYNQSPDWSPKGDKIVYSARESGGFNILMMDPDGTNTTVITQGQGFGSCEYPVFSPDGRAIALTSGSTKWRNIRIFNIDASYTKVLTKPGSNDKNPAWSPRLID